MKIKAKEILTPIIVLTLIAAVMAALLGSTNLLTKDKIALLAAENEKLAVSKVIKADEYTKKEVEYNSTVYSYYEAVLNSAVVGYAFTVSDNGYGGAVSAVVGIDTIGKITAVEIIDVSNETPGLGQNAKNKSFYEQFSGKLGEVSVVKNGAVNNQINAVTGATITSKAVANAVNLSFKLYDEIKKEGDK